MSGAVAGLARNRGGFRKLLVFLCSSQLKPRFCLRTLNLDFMNLREHLKQNPFVLAPMAGITDSAFRSFMKEMGAGVVVTELVSGAGIDYGSKRTLDLMAFTPEQSPIGIQLFGEDADQVARAAQVAESRGCDFVDLNFGCPVPKVVKKGAGSALLKDLKALELMIRRVKGALKIPLTIKIRTGWDEGSKNAVEVCHIAFNEGVEWVAIHGRTRAQGYSGKADWNYIGEVKSKSKIPVLGNGDLTSPSLAVSRLRESECDGVLIGRGALKNPFIFTDAQGLWLDGELPSGQARDLWSVFNKLKTLVLTQCDERLSLIQLKKFAAWYSTGYAGASEFRRELFQLKELSELLARAEAFFAPITIELQADTSQEDFLMGGHG